ncbi:hypothetical protein MNBD_ALPHA03-1264 [hydrothermal vent metagenome]|uniref:Uncharacterized protein n=1 Tax=hydrothermal vent metagenome TaxID=652676 RepID=A0A3B1APP4_9ZZZZ
MKMATYKRRVSDNCLRDYQLIARFNLVDRFIDSGGADADIETLLRSCDPLSDGKTYIIDGFNIRRLHVDRWLVTKNKFVLNVVMFMLFVSVILIISGVVSWN